MKLEYTDTTTELSTERNNVKTYTTLHYDAVHVFHSSTDLHFSLGFLVYSDMYWTQAQPIRGGTAPMEGEPDELAG